MSILMPTSVHLPPPLLAAVDRRARRMRISRNRLIVQALERELARDSAWSPGFLDWLRNVDDSLSGAVDDLMVAVRANRRSKKPLVL